MEVKQAYLEEKIVNIEIDCTIKSEEKIDLIKKLTIDLENMNQDEFNKELTSYLKLKKYLVNQNFNEVIKGFNKAPNKDDLISCGLKRAKMFDDKIKKIHPQNRAVYGFYLNLWKRSYMINTQDDKVMRVWFPLVILDNIVKQTLVKVHVDLHNKKTIKKVSDALLKYVKNLNSSELQKISFGDKWNFFFMEMKREEVKKQKPEGISINMKNDVKLVYEKYRNPISHGEYRKKNKEFLKYENEHKIIELEELVLGLLQYDVEELYMKYNFDEKKFINFVHEALSKKTQNFKEQHEFRENRKVNI